MKLFISLTLLLGLLFIGYSQAQEIAKCPENCISDCDKDLRCNAIRQSQGRDVVYCKPGFRGHRCDYKCSNETFGQNCRNPCKCENGGTCDYITGKCKCQLGYVGEHCEFIYLKKSELQEYVTQYWNGRDVNQFYCKFLVKF